MKTTQRKSITFFEEDTSFTIFKPFSSEYQHEVFVVTENAYGEIHGELKRIVDIKYSFSMTDEEFDEILSKL